MLTHCLTACPSSSEHASLSLTPPYLLTGRPQLFVSLLVGYASEQGLQTRSVLPLSSPLPLPLQPNLFIRLCRHAYLVVMATAEQGLEVQYYLLKEQLVLDEGGGMEEAASRAFSTCSLVELEEREVLHSHLRVVLGVLCRSMVSNVSVHNLLFGMCVLLGFLCLCPCGN